MSFFIIFIIISLTEIALFVVVGDIVGLVLTLLLCVVTAMIGAALIRHQGLQTVFAAKEALQHNELPINELFDGICLAIAGVTLMTPGFFTDGIGFSLLFPPLRLALRHYLAQKFKVHMQEDIQGSDKNYEAGNNNSRFIEGEFEKLDEEKD